MLFNMFTKYRYLLFFLLLLPPFFFRDYTAGNELRYLSIVDEALRNNTWFTFHNHGEAYADKPPLFFWGMMVLKLLTGTHCMWLIGCLTLLPVIGILGVMDRWMREQQMPHHPWVSNGLLLTTGIFLGSALVIRMDMLMLFFIVLALYTFYRMYRGNGRVQDKWLLPLWVFLAVFSKGPIGILIPLVVIPVFLASVRQLRTLGRYLGFPFWGVLLLLCFGWFGMTYLEGGDEYLHNLLVKQTVGRGINSFRHHHPFWYYLPRLPWSFAPWTLLYVVVLVAGIRKKLLAGDTERFFLTVILVTFVMLSLVSSKLDIYLLPIYPFVAYLCASLLSRIPRGRWLNAGILLPVILFLIVPPAAAVAGRWLPQGFTVGTAAYTGIILLTLGGSVAGVLLKFRQPEKAISALAGGVLLLIATASFSIPPVNRFIGFREMAEKAGQCAEERQIRGLYYYKHTDFADMDAYLHRPVDPVVSPQAFDSLRRAEAPFILFVRDKEIRRDPDFGSRMETFTPLWHENGFRWYLIPPPPLPDPAPAPTK